MRLRQLVPCLAVLVAVLAAPGCEYGNLKKYQDHVLNRIGYGPDPWSRTRIQQLGINGYIDEQLDPSALDDTALEDEIASLYPVTTMNFATSRTTFNEYTGNPDTGPYVPLRDGTRAKLLRSVKSKKQLEQVLVDFWFNHFNVDGNVEEARWGFLTMERQAIRPYVFGKFKTMLRKVAENPGMSDYLDNALNFKDGFVYLNLTRGINENYAREVLELHTVGVDGGYTQADIREVARAFTGWTMPTTFQFYPDGFLFLSQGHDRNAKSIFGGALQLAANRGQQDGIDVINFLAGLPQTAERISRKLCQRFISETAPPENVVQAAKQVYLDTDGDLREVMRTILYSGEFRDYNHAGSKVKRPLHYVASLARAVGVRDDATFAESMDGPLQRMGEGLYRAGPPTGYPESSRFWSGEGGYVQRTTLAWQAAHGEAGFAGNFLVYGITPTEIVDDLRKQLLRNGIESTTRQALIDLATSLPSAARIQEVAATMLASPDFLVH